MTTDRDLERWIDAEYPVAARELFCSVSATGIEYQRTAFGQRIRPARGSVLASPVTQRAPGEPDYFFHWLRDSAIVMGAVQVLIADGTVAAEGHAAFADFVAFSLKLDTLDGHRLAADPDYGARVAPDVKQFLRPRTELAEVSGDRIRMETRFNPDGTLDVLRWSRPQLDGPATRALVLMQYARHHPASDALSALLESDIDFALRHAGADSYDIWEERYCADYYTRSVQQQVLAQAAVSARARGESARAAALSSASARLAELLDTHWSEHQGCYLSAVGTDRPGDRDIDFAVIFAALHSDRAEGDHSILDPRMQATLRRLIAVFAEDYQINRATPDAAPALGRFRGDSYQSGGAWYISTLGAAEFHYRLAQAAVRQPLVSDSVNQAFRLQAGVASRSMGAQALASALTARGDAFMRTVMRFTPDSGVLSEQFDQNDGRQTSARRLTWSYAAFITAVSARRQAVTAQLKCG